MCKKNRKNRGVNWASDKLLGGFWRLTWKWESMYVVAHGSGKRLSSSTCGPLDGPSFPRGPAGLLLFCSCRVPATSVYRGRATAGEAAAQKKRCFGAKLAPGGRSWGEGSVILGGFWPRPVAWYGSGWVTVIVAEKVFFGGNYGIESRCVQWIEELWGLSWDTVDPLKRFANKPLLESHINKWILR